MTDTEFNTIMGLASLASISGVKANYGSAPAGGTCPTPDEGTNGLLDHIFVYWNSTSHLFTFNLKHRKIL